MTTDTDDTTDAEYPTTDDGHPLVPEADVLGVFPDESQWGHRISFEDYDDRRVSGHVSPDDAPRVSEGDLFAYQLESGRIGVFRLVDVDHCLDPRDMFFASAEDVGYLDGFAEERDQPVAPSDLPDPADCPECGAEDQPVAVWQVDMHAPGRVKRRIDCEVCGHSETETKKTVPFGPNPW